MKSGTVNSVVKPSRIGSVQPSLRNPPYEPQAQDGFTRSEAHVELVREVLQDAVRRGALLAVVGPHGSPPAGAARVLRITEKPGPPGMLPPAKLPRITAVIEEHLARVERPVVYLTDLASLEEFHGKHGVKSWILRISRRCRDRAGSVVLGFSDYELASEVATESGPLQTDAALQCMLESLVSPIRRAIVSYIFAFGSVTYSSILRTRLVESSSKLSFHLQKLLHDGLLTRGRGGTYVLTEDGHRSWRVVQAIIDELRPAFPLVESG